MLRAKGTHMGYQHLDTNKGTNMPLGMSANAERV